MFCWSMNLGCTFSLLSIKRQIQCIFNNQKYCITWFFKNLKWFLLTSYWWKVEFPVTILLETGCFYWNVIFDDLNMLFLVVIKCYIKTQHSILNIILNAWFHGVFQLLNLKLFCVISFTTIKVNSKALKVDNPINHHLSASLL
jgi:hypothetical protein